MEKLYLGDVTVGQRIIKGTRQLVGSAGIIVVLSSFKLDEQRRPA